MDLEVWLNKIRQTRSHAEVFAILDEFRTHEWTDEQGSKMARLYMRMLDNFGPLRHDDDEKASSSGDKKDAKDSKESKSSKDAKDGKLKEAVGAAAAAGAAPSGASAEGTGEIKPVTTGATPVNDGPVWYEKM